MFSGSSVFISWNDFEQLKFYCIEVKIVVNKTTHCDKRHLVLILPIQSSEVTTVAVQTVTLPLSVYSVCLG